MAYIQYASDDIPESDRVDDSDNIIQIHSIHPRIMRLHYDLYVETMRKPSPVSRCQREMIAVAVSAKNNCHY